MSSPESLFFYDGGRYWMSNGEVAYIPLNEASVKRHLKSMCVDPRPDIDGKLNWIQLHQHVTYAGPLAGYRRGLHRTGKQKFLVTEGPTVVQASASPFDTISAVIDGLLGKKQAAYFWSWLKVARRTLQSGNYQPGQVLVLAGPPGCGKSLLIDLLKEMLGGRRANPYAAWSAVTNFNGDLLGSELLVIDDEAGAKDGKSRCRLAASIKNSLFSGEVRIERKGKEAFTCRPFWRVVIACNEEPENLLVLPQLTGDMKDKIMLLKCQRASRPMPHATRKAFWDRLASEVPGFLDWLESEWEIPEELREERCGVLAYQHSDLVAALECLAPEKKLEGLLEASLCIEGRWDDAKRRAFTADEIEARVSDSAYGVASAARNIPNYPGAWGRYLAQLARSNSPIVSLASRDTNRGVNRYQLSKPPASG